MSDTATPQQPTDDQRKQALANAVAREVGNGCRVESQTDFQAVVVKGKRPSHLLHLILSLVTLGIWIPVWILVAIFGGEKRKVLMVDAWGNVSRS
ncbi:hypothetical protein [Candidatus Neomicrothrix sp.]|jgi:hypothetical protein|uniref:hypothetical protein n=1 Tax=Candidatus Neomicrothrix sp. TaxID=2719034 RepID=UPI001B65F899|nr:hypothetical protein [Candidatus Microthrix sp.]MBP7988850.1 hypothetical protein [Candidatus Microthrix sp.]